MGRGGGGGEMEGKNASEIKESKANVFEAAFKIIEPHKFEYFTKRK